MRPFNTLALSLLLPVLCSGCRMALPTSPLPMTGTQHLSLLEMRISSPTHSPGAFEWLAFLAALLGAAQALGHWRRLLTATQCPMHPQLCSREPAVSPARQIKKHRLWSVPYTPQRLEGPHSKPDLEIKYKTPSTGIPTEQPCYYRFKDGKKVKIVFAGCPSWTCPCE